MPVPENEVVFYHHNYPKHTAKLSKNGKKNKKYEGLQWPTQLPDLNPIY